MQDGYYLKRSGVCAVHNKIRADWPEAHIAVGKIGPGMPLPWPLRKLLKRIEKLIQQPVGRTYIVRGDEVPNALQVLKCFRRKQIGPSLYLLKG